MSGRNFQSRRRGFAVGPRNCVYPCGAKLEEKLHLARYANVILSIACQLLVEIIHSGSSDYHIGFNSVEIILAQMKLYIFLYKTLLIRYYHVQLFLLIPLLPQHVKTL